VKLAVFWFVLFALVSMAGGPLSSVFGWTGNEQWVLWAVQSFFLILSVIRIRSLQAGSQFAIGQSTQVTKNG
jgi:hypothetical protein